MKLATAAQMKALDKKAIETWNIPSINLMERAAEGVAQAALDLLPKDGKKSCASVFCGAGNNGGDGVAAARFLFLAGVQVRVFLVGSYERLTPDALEETRRLSECGVLLEPFDPANEEQTVWARRSQVIIDAIFGVGLSRNIAPDSAFEAAVDLINRCRGKVVAADIASGVAADTGKVLGRAVRADVTVTFTLKKIGQAVGDGAVLSGEVRVQDIGIPKALVREVNGLIHTVEGEFVCAALPPRKPDGHKGDFGKLLVVGGAVGYTGAPYLAAEAAVRSGCGLVYLGVPESIWEIEAIRCASAMPFPLLDKGGQLSRKALPVILEKLKSCDVLAIGPGLGRNEETARVVRALLESTEQPVVLDADGINALEGHIDSLDVRRDRGWQTILTPHDGEFARVGGDLTPGRAEAARTFALRHGCTLVLKGHRTVTATEAGTALVNTTGNSGLAKGGSGDVLTGLIAALLAQGATPAQAAAGGVWLHGRAGDLAAKALTEYCMTPEDVIRNLPAAFAELGVRS